MHHRDFRPFSQLYDFGFFDMVDEVRFYDLGIFRVFLQLYDFQIPTDCRPNYRPNTDKILALMYNNAQLASELERLLSTQRVISGRWGLRFVELNDFQDMPDHPGFPKIIHIQVSKNKSEGFFWRYIEQKRFFRSEYVL